MGRSSSTRKFFLLAIVIAFSGYRVTRSLVRTFIISGNSDAANAADETSSSSSNLLPFNFQVALPKFASYDGTNAVSISEFLLKSQTQATRRQRSEDQQTEWDPYVVVNTSSSADWHFEMNATIETLVCQTLSGATVSLPRKVPSFVIIGAQKASTTALAGILSRHPSVVSSHKREPHFFDRGYANYQGTLTPNQACTLRLEYLRENFDVKRYLNRFGYDGKMLHMFEKTPSYIRHPGAARTMHQVLGNDIKIIAALRNPISRSYSHYKMEKQRMVQMAETYDKLVAAEVEALRLAGLTEAFPLEQFDPTEDYDDLQTPYTFQLYQSPSNFSSRREMVAKATTPRQYKVKHMKDSSLYTGMYATQLEEWLHYYKLGTNLFVVRAEELMANASAVLNRVQAFLGLPLMDFRESVIEKDYNPLKGGTGWREGAAIHVDEPSASTIAYLKQFYQPYNDELADLLGDDWSGVWD